MSGKLSVAGNRYRIDRGVRKDSTLHVGAPNIGDRRLFNQLVDGIFDRNWFTNGGELVKELESQLRDFLGVKHCMVVCNGTVGLQLAFHALELTGEVIVPSFTFVATPHAAQWEGLTPVFADIEPATHTLCPRSVESLISEKTAAIVGVHLWGNPCNTAAIQRIADQHGLKVIYDAAHAFACANGDRMVGNFGDCEVFSFHATKFFNTFEGGAIATNDDGLAERISLMKNFGFSGMDRVTHLGTNAKMPEVCAAMGLSMFPSLDRLIARNRYNHHLYEAHFDGLHGVRLLDHDQVSHSNWQYVVIEIDPKKFGASRDVVMERLHQENIRARRYFFPGCHRMEPYRSRTTHRRGSLKITETICDRVLCLPSGSAIEESDIERVCRIVRGY